MKIMMMIGEDDFNLEKKINLIFFNRKKKILKDFVFY